MMKLLLFILLCSIPFFGYAGDVDSIKALKVAENYFTKIKPLKSAPQFKRAYWQSKQKSHSPFSGNTPAFYIFNHINNGFIIVSGNDNVKPILAYSPTGNICIENMPPALSDWLKWRESEIQLLSKGLIEPLKSVASEWELAERGLLSAQVSMSGKEPLIKTNWGQGTNYNDLCPVDSASGYSNYRVPVGCVATSMAQIMKYWEYPINGIGSRSYTHTKYGLLSANFAATTYNWSSMPNLALSTNNAIATISYHCGVSVNMNYGPTGSSASVSTASQSLINYFNYKNTLSHIRKSDYTSTAWHNLIKTEIDNYMPVILRGAASDGNGGHAYICDGYTIDNYFHINWGWTGSYNGYFLFDDLTPGSNNFTYYQYATIGIKPNGNSCAVYPVALTINAENECSGNLRIVSNTSWTVSSNQTWLSVSASSGTGCNTIVLTSTSANNTGANRSATITVTASGLTSKTITVTQLATSSNLSNLKPYKPTGWGDYIVLSKTKNTTTDDILTQNDSVYLDFAFYNYGPGNITTPFYCWISLDSITIIEGLRTSLTSGYYVSSRDNILGRLSVGNHKIKMIIDPLNEINETNETDNIYTKLFTVYDASTTSIRTKPENNSQFVVFPNPATDFINIFPSTLQIREITVISSTGVIVLFKKHIGSYENINISNLQPGYYIMLIKTNDNLYRNTFIKKSLK